MSVMTLGVEQPGFQRVTGLLFLCRVVDDTVLVMLDIGACLSEKCLNQLGFTTTGVPEQGNVADWR